MCIRDRLYVKLGTQHCIHDGTAVAPQTPDSIAAQLMTSFRGQHIGLLAPLVMNRKGVYTELADWARPRRFTHLRVDGKMCIRDSAKAVELDWQAPAPRPELESDPNFSEANQKTLKLLLDEICTRLKYLNEVGIGYLTLDRQSRTLSGGEVQRINLTTALGTSLVNTLFVLDEPSIGLHPRDMHRIIVAMQRLRDAGNTLVVVEHDPAVMLAADRMICLLYTSRCV